MYTHLRDLVYAGNTQELQHAISCYWSHQPLLLGSISSRLVNESIASLNVDLIQSLLSFGFQPSLVAYKDILMFLTEGIHDNYDNLPQVIRMLLPFMDTFAQTFDAEVYYMHTKLIEEHASDCIHFVDEVRGQSLHLLAPWYLKACQHKSFGQRRWKARALMVAQLESSLQQLKERRSRNSTDDHSAEYQYLINGTKRMLDHFVRTYEGLDTLRFHENVLVLQLKQELALCQLCNIRYERWVSSEHVFSLCNALLA